MQLFSFNNLVERFGEAAAWHYLTEIEKAAGLRPAPCYSQCPDGRLAHALQVQDARERQAIAA